MFKLWNQKSPDFTFLDNQIGEWFKISGAEIRVYKYLGTWPQNSDDTRSISELVIQDNIFLENRDRAYSDQYYILDGIFSVSDMELDLRQFAAFIEGDIIYIEFHYTKMVEKIGRKLMPGDVFCLPNMIDRDLLNPDSPAIMKYYVVDDASRAADGYGPTWNYHIWRCKCKPMPDTQEFNDITNRPAVDSNGDPITGINGNGDNSLNDIMSTYNANMNIMQAVNDAARSVWNRHGYEQRNIYITKNHKGLEFAEIWVGQGAPDGSISVREGTEWPKDAKLNEYFLRTDWMPPLLYKNTLTGWDKIHLYYGHYRHAVYCANSNAVSFINNNATIDGTPLNTPVKQDIKYIVKPRADF